MLGLFSAAALLCAKEEVAQPFVWGTAVPIAKVRPLDPARGTPAKSTHPFAARNEFEPFQIVLRAEVKHLQFGGNGEGTLFYPGRPDRIGGRTDIPVESIRLKLTREGMEDYEYLTMPAKLGSRRFADEYADRIVKKSYRWESRPETSRYGRNWARRSIGRLHPGRQIDA